MLKHSPQLLAFGFSTAPVAAPLFPMMLLWYAIIGMMGLLSAAGTIISYLDWRDKRAERDDAKRERKAAGGMGGYVTHEVMLSELKRVYDTMREEDRALRGDITTDLTEIKITLKQVTHSLQNLANEHARLDGRLDPVFTPPGPRKAATH